MIGTDVGADTSAAVGRRTDEILCWSLEKRGDLWYRSVTRGEQQDLEEKTTPRQGEKVRDDSVALVDFEQKSSWQ